MKRRKQILSVVLAASMLASTLPVGVLAAEPNGVPGGDSNPTDLDLTGYSEVWSDEFLGDALNRDDWNVELHNPGWVNSELQAYVDSADNISVKDGMLYLTPIKKVETLAKNMLADTSAIEGSFELTEDQVSGNPWDVQKLIEGLTVEEGKTYYVTFDASSTVARNIQAGVQKRSGDYATYGETTANLTSTAKSFSYIFTSSVTDDNAGIFFNLGKNGENTPASTVTISNVVMKEVPVAFASDATSEVQGEFDITEANMGSDPWDVQKLSKISVENGKTYLVEFSASSTETRKIVAGVQKTTADWDQYGQSEIEINNVAQKYSYSFTMNTTDDNAGIYFNLGKNGVTPESTISITDVKVYDITSSSEGTKTTYTSGRINTQGIHDFTYGYFETRAKVPAGQGYLPAFWLMSSDENIYGQWPRCGEIDIMEVMGQETDKLYGTIHYGNPHSQGQGTYIAEEGKDFADEFHTFGCEWEPGSIKWYVDGKCYYEEHNWYSTTEGQGTLTYPAPFDQPFYMILNLAVGGSWVGNPDENTSFDNNPYIVDYVKVYQKDSYDNNVEKPVVNVELRDPDANGNYINNGDFAVEEDLTDDTDWKFMVDEKDHKGKATAAIKDKTIEIKTEEMGDIDYSIQLVQANVPFEKGATYELSFDAFASENRTMNVDVKAPDHGYIKYMETLAPELTTTKKTFKKTFKMTSDSDANGRLEFNMGNTSTADITITNVSIKKTMEADPNEVEEKTVLANGNYIYNGSFQEGKNRLGYWNIEAVNTEYAVTGFADGRRLKVDPAPFTIEPFALSQNGLAITEGKDYVLSFDVDSKENGIVKVNLGGNLYTLLFDNETENLSIVIDKDTKFENGDISFEIFTSDTVYLDNFYLVESALIKNGSFNDGTTGFEVYVDSSAKASYAVDSLKEDNALDFTINNTSDQDWKIQVKQNNVKLENGKTYRLTYKAKSSIDREIRVIMQGLEPLGWPVYSGDDNAVVSLTNEYQTFSYTFEMKDATDPAAFLSICLGMLNDRIITEQHTVTIDDISLVEVGEAADPGVNPGGDADVIGTIAPITAMTYTGSEVKPVVAVYDGDVRLVLNKDYTVTYKNNINAASKGNEFDESLPTVIVTGKGNYSGTVKENFTINPRMISDEIGRPLGVTLSINDHVVVNATKNQEVINSIKALKPMVYGKDYDTQLMVVNAKNEKNETVPPMTILDDTKIPAGYSGTFMLMINGKGNYAGTILKRVYTSDKITLMNKASVTLGKNVKTAKYTGENITLTPATYDTETKKFYAPNGKEVSKNDAFVVKSGTKYLVCGKDYTVSYANNKSVGTATMTIRGIGEYMGTKTVTFKINGSALSASKVKVEGLADVEYTGEAIAPALKVSYAVDKKVSKDLRAAREYKVSYKNNVNAGKATVTITGNPAYGYTGTVTKTFKITPVNLLDVIPSDSMPAALAAPYNKAGATINDSIELETELGKQLVEGVDYKVSYKNNKNNAGTKAQAVVKGIKNFTGSLTFDFSINASNFTEDEIDISVASVKYDSKAASTKVYKPAVTVKMGGAKLTANKDYKVEYVNTSQESLNYLSESDPSKFPAVIVYPVGSNFVANDEGIRIPVHVYSVTITKSNTMVVVTGDTEYTGEQVTPEVRVFMFESAADKKAHENETNLEMLGKYEISPDWYQVSYGTNKVAGKGKGTVTVTAKYFGLGGSVSTKFDIIPKFVSEK